MPQMTQLKRDILMQRGAGRGSRTPMELPPPDFESAAYKRKPFTNNSLFLAEWKLSNFMCKSLVFFTALLDHERPESVPLFF